MYNNNYNQDFATAVARSLNNARRQAPASKNAAGPSSYGLSTPLKRAPVIERRQMTDRDRYLLTVRMNDEDVALASLGAGRDVADVIDVAHDGDCFFRAVATAFCFPNTTTLRRNNVPSVEHWFDAFTQDRKVTDLVEELRSVCAMAILRDDDFFRITQPEFMVRDGNGAVHQVEYNVRDYAEAIAEFYKFPKGTNVFTNVQVQTFSDALIVLEGRRQLGSLTPDEQTFMKRVRMNYGKIVMNTAASQRNVYDKRIVFATDKMFYTVAEHLQCTIVMTSNVQPTGITGRRREPTDGSVIAPENVPSRGFIYLYGGREDAGGEHFQLVHLRGQPLLTQNPPVVT